MIRKTLLISALVCFSGCAAWHPIHHLETSGEVPEFYAHYYEYPRAEIRSENLGEEVTDSYVLRKIQFELSLPEELQPKDFENFKKYVEELAKTDQKTANDLRLRYTNRIDYYIPRNLKPGQKRPVILISPILGGNMVVDRFAKYYAGRGYLAAIVYRKKPFWDDEDKRRDQLERYMRFSVIRLRQVVDWLEIQPEVDPQKIGAFGVSYGAILHSVLAAVEPRIKYHVLAMPAGDLPEVIMNCPDKGVSKLVKHVHEKYGWSHEEIRADLEATVKTEPLDLAPYVPREKVQIYIALFDRVVGAGRSWQLWRAMRKPSLKLMPFGHYGGVSIFPYLQTQSYQAFKRHLK